MDSDQKRKQVVEYQKLASTIIQDPIYSNQIQRFIEALASLNTSDKVADELYIDTLIRCVGKIFTFYIDSRELVLSRNTDPTNESINQYKLHLIRWYDRVVDELCRIVRNADLDAQFSLNIQKLALITLIKFVEEEGNFAYI